MKNNTVSKELEEKIDQIKKDNAGNDTKRNIGDRELSADVEAINPDANSMESRG